MILLDDRTEPESCSACLRRPAGHGHFALYCVECAELPLMADAAYCGTFPARDHSDCASSVECTG